MKPTLLVMAAGMGSRYGGLKQIDPLGPHGETIIEYSVYDAIRAGFGKVVFVIRKEIENDFKEVYMRKFDSSVNVEYVFQELDMLPQGFTLPEQRQKPWGTAHAVLMAKDVIREPFAVINADDYYGVHAFEVMEEYLGKLSNVSTDYAMVGYFLGNTMSEHGSVSRGVCRKNGDDWLEDVTERTKIQYTAGGIADIQEGLAPLELKEHDIVSMNFWGFTPAYFDQTQQLFAEFLQEHIHEPKSEFYIPLAVDTLIKEGKARIKVLGSNDKWFGVTYKEDKPLVQEKLDTLTRAGVYPAALWIQE